MAKRWIPVMPLLFLVMGCSTVSSTAKFYTPATPAKYAPKPKTYKVIIANEYPSRRPYSVIGTLSFSAVQSADYMQRSMEYNARQNGADAVVVTEWRANDELQPFFVPGYTTYDPVTTHSSGSVYGRTSGSYYGRSYSNYTSNTSGYYSGTSTTQVPVHHPGYSGVRTVTRIHLTCSMIVFEDKDTRAVMGVVFQEVANADYFRVADVVPGSPAADAGLIPGDKVYAIDDYQCDKGIRDWQEKAPLLKAGQVVNLAVLRGSEELTVRVIPQLEAQASGAMP